MRFGIKKQHVMLTLWDCFLAAMSSSRSDDVTQFVRSCVILFLLWSIRSIRIKMSISRVFIECFNSVSKLFQECIKNVSNVLQECFNCVSRVLQDCFKSVSEGYQECFKSFSRVLKSV